MSTLTAPHAPISYDLDGAATATGVSDRTLRNAIASGDLVAHYIGRKPVILRDDLADYVRALPTTKAAS